MDMEILMMELLLQKERCKMSESRNSGESRTTYVATHIVKVEVKKVDS